MPALFDCTLDLSFSQCGPHVSAFKFLGVLKCHREHSPTACPRPPPVLLQPSFVENRLSQLATGLIHCRLCSSQELQSSFLPQSDVVLLLSLKPVWMRGRARTASRSVTEAGIAARRRWGVGSAIIACSISAPSIPYRSSSALQQHTACACHEMVATFPHLQCGLMLGLSCCMQLGRQS